MELEQVISQNTAVMQEMLEELRSIKTVLSRQQGDDLTVKEALVVLGLNNERYLTYFYRLKLLNRRKGGSSYLYSKRECSELSAKLRDKVVVPPTMRQIYKMTSDAD